MIWLVILLVIGIAVVGLPYVGGRKARWFRRIWASQQTGGALGDAWRIDATQKLLDLYGVDFAADADSLRRKFGDMFADASRFDITNSNNRGIQVMPLFARTVLGIKGSQRHPELDADLIQMSQTDGLATFAAMQKALEQH